jgi:hypothetical protein
VLGCPANVGVQELPYKWTQVLGDLDVTVPVPKGTRGRDLVVVLQKKKLSVGLKGKEPIMSGELFADVKMEESTWTLGMLGSPRRAHRSSHTMARVEDQESVLIHLQKLNNQQWWPHVLTHHPKIDTKKIQPDNSKLSDLDGETRRAHF